MKRLSLLAISGQENPEKNQSAHPRYSIQSLWRNR